MKQSRYNLRKCTINGVRAWFHGFFTRSEIIEPSILIGGHQGGNYFYTVVIVEFEDGSIAEYNASSVDIKFTDQMKRI